MNYKQNLFAETSVEEIMEACAPHQRALVSILAVSHCQGISPVPFIEKLSRELSRKRGWPIWELGASISDGNSPVSALAEIKALPPTAVLAFQLAEQDGTLDELFTAITDRPVEYANMRRRLNFVSDTFLLIAKAHLTIGIVAFFMLYIVPEFMKMFEEFGVEITPMLRLLILMADTAAKFAIAIPIALILALIFVVPISKRALAMFDPMTWQQISRPKSTIHRIMISMLTQSKNALSRGILLMKRVTMPKSFFKKIAPLKRRLQRRESDWVALAGERLITQKESNILSMTSNQEMQAWLLRWFGQKKEIEKSGRLFWSFRTFVVLVNIGIIAFVAVTCFAVFSSLIQLMNSLG